MRLINLTHVFNIIFDWGVLLMLDSLGSAHLYVEFVLSISDGFHDLFVFGFLGVEDVIGVDIVFTLEEVVFTSMFFGGSLFL
jgi:hypothetical protein